MRPRCLLFVYFLFNVDLDKLSVALVEVLHDNFKLFRFNQKAKFHQSQNSRLSNFCMTMIDELDKKNLLLQERKLACSLQA